MDVMPVRAQAAIFGILNLTEDSFSDGGKYVDPVRAIERAIELTADGAAVIYVAVDGNLWLQPVPGAGRGSAEQVSAMIKAVAVL